MSHLEVSFQVLGPPRMDNRLQPQLDFQVRLIGEAHLQNRGYLGQPVAAPKSNDRSYRSNEKFWSDILSGQLRSTFAVALSKFNLFEWFPRSPGLYHTPHAMYAREEALRHIDYKFPDSSDITRDHANPMRRRRNRENVRDDKSIVFTPMGKQSMLEGGIGCIRLKPIKFPEGTFWFMSASSTGSADEGIPVAIADDAYGTVIEIIQSHGYCRCDLIGKIKLLGEDLSNLYSSFGAVPQIYVQIEKLTPQTTRKSAADISVAVSFKGTVEGREGVYAAYVTFDPSQQDSRSEAVDWLRSKYVEGRYAGKIITDFDQQANVFSRTLFSLDTVMTSENIDGILRSFSNDRALSSLTQLKDSRVLVIGTNYGSVEMSENIVKGSQGVVIVNKSAGATVSATISVSELPHASDVDITKELNALKDWLQKLDSGDRKRNIDSAMDEALDEAKRPSPDKDVIGQAAERALKFAQKANDFSENVEKAIPRIKQVTGWLGDNWHKLLPLVGIGISAV
jgi:hypothetical protein